MKTQLSKEAEERAKARAQENLENLLKELDKKDKKDPYIGDPYADEYSHKTYEGEIVKILADYDERKRQAKEKLRVLRREARIEARDGFVHLSREKKYKIIGRRRYEVERIVTEAHLGSKDTRKLLVPNVNKLYNKIYNFFTLDKHNYDEE